MNPIAKFGSTRSNGKSVGARRINHGSMAWSALDALRQPQDGAPDMRATVTDIGARMQRGAAGNAASFEPEDARLTGGTRSLMRRMLGLNIASRSAPGALQIVTKRLA